MRTKSNDYDGVTVILTGENRLDQVPASHQSLVTPAIREAFADPPAFFLALAKQCSFPKMALWLQKLVAANDWSLVLHQAEPEFLSLAGFEWGNNEVKGATIALPHQPNLVGLPPTLQTYYSLVSEIHWNGYGSAGGLDASSNPYPISQFGFEIQGAAINPERAYVWGSSVHGDMLIYTYDGQGGWFTHDTHHVHLLGTIEETIDWIFTQLLARSDPKCDNSWE